MAWRGLVGSIQIKYGRTVAFNKFWLRRLNYGNSLPLTEEDEHSACGLLWMLDSYLTEWCAFHLIKLCCYQISDDYLSYIFDCITKWWLKKIYDNYGEKTSQEYNSHLYNNLYKQLYLPFNPGKRFMWAKNSSFNNII